MSTWPVMVTRRGDSRMQENMRWQGHHLGSSNSQGTQCFHQGLGRFGASGSCWGCRGQARLAAEPHVWACGRGFLTLLGQIPAEDRSVFSPPILDIFLLEVLVPAAPWLLVGPRDNSTNKEHTDTKEKLHTQPISMWRLFFSSSRTCVFVVAMLYCTH